MNSPVKRPKRRILALALALPAALFAAAALAEDSAMGAGTRLASGSKVAAEIGNTFSVPPNDDFDDYIFDGYRGQTATITVAKGKSGNLIPSVELYRPDGSLVEILDGAKIVPAPGPSPKVSKTSKITFKLDATGVWTVRVRGQFPSVKVIGDNPLTPDDPDTPIVENKETFYYTFDYGTNGANRTTGQYSISLKATAAPGVAAKNFVDDASDQYRFELSATGGATIAGAFKFSGGAPTFVSMKDPSGKDVTGFVNSITTSTKAITIKPFVLPNDSPLGTYVLTFQANPDTVAFKTSFASKLVLPKGTKPLKATFDREEPFIVSVNPAEGGTGSTMTLTVGRALDTHGNGTPRVFIGKAELLNVVLTNNNATIQGKVPAGLGNGEVFDVTLWSSAGQAAVKSKSFRVVPPPAVSSIDPIVGTAAGGFPITITGSNFNTATLGMGIRIDGGLVPVAITAVTTTSITFTAPSWPPGPVQFGVTDTRTGQTANLPLNSFTFTETAQINRITPALVPTLGGEPMFISGANFKNTDQIFLETGPNTGDYNLNTIFNRFDAVTPGTGSHTLLTSSFVNDRLHTFTAPPRSAIGDIRVRIMDATNFTTQPRTYAYFSFADFSSRIALPGGSDQFDAATTAVADFDNDGDMDLFLARVGGTSAASSSQTRVLRNDGTGRLTDVTTGTNGVMPATLADDDWRADRIQVVDINADTYPDIVIVTNSTTIPAAMKSHVRFLINERRSATLAVTERAFRDRTLDLAPPTKVMAKLYGSGGQTPDDWRGMDMFVGDIDANTANPPEIVITHDETKDDIYVGCAPYCASPFASFYTYSFYWGGTRAFVWDKNARGGLGRYKFDYNFFPRKAGVTVPVFNPPPGVTIKTCQTNECRGKFPPFVGQKLAVGILDDDGKPDFVVASNKTVSQNGGTISSLQVALNKFNPADGAGVTDMTPKLTLMSGDYRAEAIAIGQPGYPDGNAYGVIGLARAASSGTTVMKFLRYKPSVISGDAGDFEDITAAVLPPVTGADRFQSSAMQFIDVDGDGDQDFVSVANVAVGSSQDPSLRVWRNEAIGGKVGVFRESLRPLLSTITTASEHFEGDCLAIGDLDKDGGLEFVVTLKSPGTRTGPLTRAVTTDR